MVACPWAVDPRPGPVRFFPPADWARAGPGGGRDIQLRQGLGCLAMWKEATFRGLALLTHSDVAETVGVFVFPWVPLLTMRRDEGAEVRS